MVKSAYYSQLPTVRCRDCGQVLDFNVKHKCNGTRPDFAADQRQRMQNGSPNHQQNPNVAYGPPRPQQQQAPYSPADSYRDEAYSNGMSPHGSPHPGQLAGRGSPNAYDRDNRARGRPQDQRYYSPEQGQRSQPQDPYEPNGRQREERSRYRDPSGGSQPRDPYSHSPQPRDKSRSRNDRERERPRDRSAPRGKNDLADIKTQGLDDRARRQNSGRDGRESPYTPQSAKKGSIDDVMSDLIDELSVDQRQPSPRADRPPANRGDSRNRRAPPACAGCGRDILEPKLAYMIPALQKTYHIQCFRCCVCQMSFDERNPYIPHENQPYCEADYNQALDTICGGCHQTIFERPVYALGKAWHEHHLRCAACRKPIQGNPFEHENKVFCSVDYAALVAPKCRECGQGIQGETICALDSTFHKECFVCATCKDPFPDKSFYVVGDEPLCRLHYHEKNNSLCGACNEPIEGPCADIAEVGKRFHPECWACHVCHVPLTSTYYSFGQRPYCENDIMTVYRQEKTQKANKRQTLMLNLDSNPSYT